MTGFYVMREAGVGEESRSSRGEKKIKEIWVVLK